MESTNHIRFVWDSNLTLFKPRVDINMIEKGFIKKIELSPVYELNKVMDEYSLEIYKIIDSEFLSASQAESLIKVQDRLNKLIENKTEQPISSIKTIRLGFWETLLIYPFALIFSLFYNE
jgi:hypothetical protein